MKKIRTLKADEIEVRPQSIKNGKANMLLYINSRAATDLLDETYKMENWTIEYKDVAGQIYGRLSIYDDETNRWVYREDTGSAGNIEAEKSLASDVVKRCIVRFGVTELYSSPKIQIEDDGYGNTGYKVSEVEYDDNRNIIHLVIVNRFNKEVFRWDKDKINTPKSTQQPDNDELMWKPETEQPEQPKAEDKINGLLSSLTEQFNTLSGNEAINLQVLKDTANYWHKIIKDGKYKASNINLQKLYNNNLERRAA